MKAIRHTIYISLLLLITGCNISIYEQPVEEEKPVVVDTSPDTDESEDTTPQVKTPVIRDISGYQTSEELLNSMTLEEKVAQLFILDFYGMTKAYHVKEANDSVSTFLADYPIGGLIFFGENVESAEQVTTTINTLQTLTSIPFFVSVDEEGGLVSRLGDADIGIDHLSNASELASTYSSEEVKQLASTLGNQMLGLGFNMDFAPVYDVNSNPDNPVIGTRAFSSKASVVSEYANAFSEGLNNAGIISTAKHFPGHGDTQTDSHLGLASITKNLDELKAFELIPFIDGINNNIPTVMIGHITANTITGTDAPATLSKELINDLLRTELNYQGVIISDSFRMGAITDFYKAENIGVMFLQAGGDIILIPSDFEATYQGIIDAVNDGTLTEERINESVLRILELKKQYNILSI